MKKAITKVPLTFLIAMLYIAILSVPIHATNINCDYYNSTIIRCFNNGSIEPYTCYHTSGLEYWNCPDLLSLDSRRDWGQADRGFYLPDSGQIVSFSDFNITFLGIKNSSTYYNLSWQANYTSGQKKANLTFSYRQDLNDDLVNERYGLHTWGNWNNFNKEVWMWKKIANINIELDDDIDVYNYWNYTSITNDTLQFQGFYLNVTNDTLIENVYNGLNIMDIESGSGYTQKWNPGLNRTLFLKAVNGSNANVWWYAISPENLTGNFSREINEWWIDSEVCAKGCDIGWSYASQRLLCSATGSASVCSAGTDRKAEYYYRLYFQGFGAVGGCTYSNGCYMAHTDSHTGVGIFKNMTWYTNTTHEYLVLNDRHAAPAYQSEWVPDFNAHTSDGNLFNVTCRSEVGAPPNREMGFFEQEQSWSVVQNRITCPVDTTSPNVTLLNPNNDSTAYTGSILFSCNASDEYPINNMTLYHNLSGIMTAEQIIDVPLYPDQTYYHWNVSVLFTEPAIIIWQCEACDTNWFCANSTYTFNLTILQSVEVDDAERLLLTSNNKKCDNILCWIRKLFSRRTF